MRFSFAVISLLVAAAASFSEAAIIPRPDGAGLQARYYADRAYPRGHSADTPHAERAEVAEESNAKRDYPTDDRMHARDFRVKREVGTDGRKVRRAPEGIKRRVHARDFRVARITY